MTHDRAGRLDARIGKGGLDMGGGLCHQGAGLSVLEAPQMEHILAALRNRIGTKAFASQADHMTDSAEDAHAGAQR